MRPMACSYCLENFDLDSRLPITLFCSHIYCKSCVLNLSDLMRNCPLDGVFVNFDSEDLNIEMIESMKFKCQKHENDLVGICKTCSIYFCSICHIEHKNCETYTGSYSSIKSFLSEIIQSVVEKSLQISDCIKNDQLIEFDDMVVVIEEHLEYLNQALEEIDLATSYNFSTESKKSIMNKYKKLENKFLPILKIESDSKLNDPIVLPSSSQNMQFQSFFKKIMGDIREPDETVREIKNQLSQNSENFILLLVKSSKTEEQYQKYFWNFVQNSLNSIKIIGFGIGRPSTPNTSIYIPFFEVQLNGQTLINDSFLIDYDPYQKTFQYFCSSTIELVPGVDLCFHMEIEGSGNYIFYSCPFNDVSINDIGGMVYSGKIPMLYLLQE